MLQPEPAADDNGRGAQALQRPAQLAPAGRRGHGVLVVGDGGADAGDAQLDGGPAGTADPAAHRPGRDIQVQGDTAVPGHSDGGDQSLPDGSLAA